MNKKEKDKIIQRMLEFNFVKYIKAEDENIFELDLCVSFDCPRRELLRNIETIKFQISKEFNRRIIILYEQVGDIIAENDIPLSIDFYIDKHRY